MSRQKKDNSVLGAAALGGLAGGVGSDIAGSMINDADASDVWLMKIIIIVTQLHRTMTGVISRLT